MKDLKVSNETHSLLFSLKNKFILDSIKKHRNKKFTYDDVLKILTSYYNSHMLKIRILNNMYQLEEKP